MLVIVPVVVLVGGLLDDVSPESFADELVVDVDCGSLSDVVVVVVFGEVVVVCWVVGTVVVVVARVEVVTGGGEDVVVVVYTVLVRLRLKAPDSVCSHRFVLLGIVLPLR